MTSDKDLMTFNQCVLFCAKDKELVEQFDRLNGTNLSLKGGNLAVGIDIATGKLAMDVEKFVLFVKECVWDRIPKEAKA